MFVRTVRRTAIPALILVHVLFSPVTATADVAVPESYGAAMRWYQRAAESGNAQAQYLLGLRYERGIDTASDTARAAQWYARAAAQGHAEAQFKLASLYARGDGVPADHAVAAQWYEKAAAQGLAAAQYNLGVALLNGEGATRDVDLALAWITLATASDLAPAVDLRDRLLRVYPAERIEAARQQANALRKKYAL